MKFNDIIARLPYWYASKKCIYLKSAPGRGKTTVLSQAPAILSKSLGKNLGVVIINGPLLTPADSVGYLVPRKVTSTNAAGEAHDHMESLYTDPFWFRTREGKRLDEYDGGIIVVDEADKMDLDVKKVIGEAALSGRLGPHTLPEGWIVWMAGNRQKDRSGSTKELDHLINRRMEIDVDDDITSFLDWCSDNNVPPLYRAFAAQNTEIVFTQNLPEKQGPWCTPRSCVEAAFYHDKLPKGSDGFMPDDPTTVEEIAGMIGDAAAGQLFAFVILEREMPKFEDIVRNPMSEKVPTKPDACMLVSFNLAHRATMDTIDAVVQYINRLPKEFGVTFGRSAVARNPQLVSSKGMMEWVRQNATLMAQIQR